MRPIILAFAVLTFTTAFGQRYADISAGNVKASFCSGGVFYMIDTGSYGSYSHYEVPKGSGRSTIFAAAPWLTGLDMYQTLRGACNTYDTNASFRFGPVAYYEVPSYEATYRKVFKITYAEVRSHVAHHSDVGYAMPDNIANWPGNGNTANGEPAELAPFVDLNGNHIYEPLIGEYPDMYGDEAVFMMLNDSLGGEQNDCTRMHTEIHVMAYSFQVPADSVLSNATFMHYKIFNRSAETFHDVLFSQYVDPDIGCPYNDRVGCDTALNSYFAYNDPDIIDSGSVCYGRVLGYGRKKVSQGVTFLDRKIITFGSQKGTGTPELMFGCHLARNWQKGLWADGQPITVGGNGYQNSTDQIRFLYPGDPRDSTQWSELHPQIGAPIAAYDRNMFGTVFLDTLYPGMSSTVDVAMVSAFASDTALPLSEIGVLKDNIQSIQRLYDQGLLYHSTSVTSGMDEVVDVELMVYPVPASGSLYLSQNVAGMHCIITDVTGREYPASVVDKRMDISGLAAGVYLLHISDGRNARNIRFVKQ